MTKSIERCLCDIKLRPLRHPVKRLYVPQGLRKFHAAPDFFMSQGIEYERIVGARGVAQGKLFHFNLLTSSITTLLQFDAAASISHFNMSLSSIILLMPLTSTIGTPYMAQI